ncbi:Pregnancy-associated plasma protein-A [Rhizoctonia solani]|uniref:Pregnancy-associated plasma protein-A n=1 Tax=Rhizoctonia solani TaxID=456999 RepID=A0A8H7IK55_9AGAM|nr:Pregnancy-associated plasma protein-A [Rhizoctonia solani]
MLFSALSALAFGISAALAAPYYNHTISRSCGSEPSAELIAAAEAHFAANKVTLKAGSTFAATIQVYWHVIQAGTTLAQGNVPDSQITSSISALNSHYSGSGLSFALAGTDRTTNANWFNSAGPSTSYQTAMKTALRKGDAKALNVYTVGFKSGSGAGLLGYATFPSSYSGNPKDDGVARHSHTKLDIGSVSTTPSRVAALLPVTMSMTLPEASAASGCPTGRDTCSGGGVDPIHNYMDYSYDSCMYEFTAGQITRLKSQIATYRGISA